MTSVLYLLPASLVLGLCALAGFLWTVRNKQYDDIDGDSVRMLNAEDRPLSKGVGIAKTRR